MEEFVHPLIAQPLKLLKTRNVTSCYCRCKRYDNIAHKYIESLLQLTRYSSRDWCDYEQRDERFLRSEHDECFGFIPSPANFIRPGKHPLSSMSPVTVKFLSNSSLYLAIDASGGSRIITSVIRALCHVLDQNMTLSDAVLAPRFHDHLVPNQVSAFSQM